MHFIRAATKDDAEILKKIHAECFSTYGNIESFNDFFAIDGSLALLAENPSPVGIIVYRIVHEQADIITIAVLPASQRQGIADALLTQAMANMASLGPRTIFLDVEDGNMAALRLYEKHGFTTFKRRKQYYKQKDGSFTDALVMMRKIA